MRLAILLLCCAGVIGGLGCVALIGGAAVGGAGYYGIHSAVKAVKNKSDPTARFGPDNLNYYTTPVWADSVFALALPDEALARKIDREGSIFLLGKKRTYLLTTGGGRLREVAGRLDGARIELETRPRELFLKDKARLWGSLTLRYVSEPNAPPGDADLRSLQSLGFQAGTSGVWQLSVPVQGMVYPAARLGAAQPAQFSRTVEIAFFNPPGNTASPPPAYGRLTDRPLTISGDALLPSVYFGLAVFEGRGL